MIESPSAKNDRRISVGRSARTHVALVLWLITASHFTFATGGPPAAIDPTTSHPLMPGIRLAALSDPHWPRQLHDKFATGFSPLCCNLTEAPKIVASVESPGSLDWLRVLQFQDHSSHLLVCDLRLTLYSEVGQPIWSRRACGNLLASGNLRHDGKDYLLLRQGSRIELLSAASGTTIWSYTFDPSYSLVVAIVDDIVRDLPGMEAAICLQWSNEGCLISFPPGEEPQIVWQRPFVAAGEWNERADHRCQIVADLSQPDAPVIWNLRRFRCRGFDARTGKQVSAIDYQIGGLPRRNYGPCVLGQGTTDQLLCVVGERVQTHVHALRLNRHGPSTLAWQHFYGEVYKNAPGVVVRAATIEDVDQDGITDMVYSVRSPDGGLLRSYIRIRSSEDGKIKWELPDHWCVATFSNVGPSRRSGLLAFEMREETIPTVGTLHVYEFNRQNVVQFAGTIDHASIPGPPVIQSDGNGQLTIAHKNTSGRDQLARFDIADGQLRLIAEWPDSTIAQCRFHSVLPRAGQDSLYLFSPQPNVIVACPWGGKPDWQLTLKGAAPRSLVAADFDGDGRAEIAAADRSGQVNVFTLERDSMRLVQDWPGQQPDKVRSQLQLPGGDMDDAYYVQFFDVDDDRQRELLQMDVTAEHTIAIVATLGTGRELWRTKLPVQAARLRRCVFNAGSFLPDARPAVAVSVGDRELVQEGTYLLDGATGELVWSRSRFQDGSISMPFRPNGIPTAFDLDGDGVDEIAMDLMSYMALVNGPDGEVKYVRPTPNIRQEGATFAGHLYNTYCPIFRFTEDRKPHWAVIAGHGSVGMMLPDPTNGLWREEFGYDMPRNMGMVDVDGDGVLEFGYSPLNDPNFYCRNAWSGQLEWKIALDHAPNSTVISADVDGDGNGEFLCGDYCLGVNADGVGKIRWRSPCSLDGAILCDLDGNGVGEIVCSTSEGIFVLGSAR